MPLFENVEKEYNELHSKVIREYRRIARVDAEDILEDIKDELDWEYICEDPNRVVDEADDKVHEKADTNVTYTFDNWLLSMVDPYPENQEVDEYFVKQAACEEGLDQAVTVYAYELWEAAIKDALVDLVKDRCRVIRG